MKLHAGFTGAGSSLNSYLFNATTLLAQLIFLSVPSELITLLIKLHYSTVCDTLRIAWVCSGRSDKPDWTGPDQKVDTKQLI